MPIPYELYDSPPPNPADNASAIPALRVRLVHGSMNQFTPADPCLDHPDPRPQNNTRRLRRRLSLSGRARFTIDDDSDDAAEERAEPPQPSQTTHSSQVPQAPQESSEPTPNLAFPFTLRHHHYHPFLHARNPDGTWRHRHRRPDFSLPTLQARMRERFNRGRLDQVDRETQQARFMDHLQRLRGGPFGIDLNFGEERREEEERERERERERDEREREEREETERIRERMREIERDRDGQRSYHYRLMQRALFNGHTTEATMGSSSAEPEPEPQAEVEEPDDDDAPVPTPPEAPMTTSYRPPTPPPIPPRSAMPPLSRSSSTTAASSTTAPTSHASTPAPLSTASATRIEDAIKTLQQDFTEILDRDDVMTMLDIFENEVKCLHFLSLSEGLREHWVRRQIWIKRMEMPAVPPSHDTFRSTESAMPAPGLRLNPYSRATSRVSSNAGSERRGSASTVGPEPRPETRQEPRPVTMEVEVEEGDHELVEDEGPDSLWNSLFARVGEARGRETLDMGSA